MKRVSFILLFMAMATFAMAAFPVNYSEKFDVSKGAKVFALKGGNEVTVSLSDVVKPMYPFVITFTFKNSNVKLLHYNTNMIMNMGRFEFTPVLKNGSYVVDKLILPKCGSGRTLWYGTLNILYLDGSKDSITFFYNVK